MTNCQENSWCNMLQHGATATMEAWTVEEKPNLSWSHPWATAPATAIVNGLMGTKISHLRQQRPIFVCLAHALLKLPR